MSTQPNNENEIKPSFAEYVLACSKFTFKNYHVPIAVTVVFVLWIVFDWGLNWKIPDNFKKIWNDELNQIVTLATLMVAIFVWFGEISENWKKTLPKRLTVIYLNENGQIVLQCIKAKLSDVADMRMLGQQIGLQMCSSDKPLDFRAPFIEQSQGKICYDLESKFFMHFFVTFTFTKIPDVLIQELGTDKYKEWTSPFTKDSNDLKIKNRP